MKNSLILLTVGVVGFFLGHTIDLPKNWILMGQHPLTEDGSQPQGVEKKVLYWVAPMDPNYRRDKPGKSPMGMDLIPVYAGQNEEKGSDVTISPEVVQNLGVRTALAKKQPMERRIDTVGYVALDETKISHVHLRTEGWVEKLWIKFEGESIQEGQLLFQYYSPALVNAQEEFLQAAASKNSALIQASRQRLLSLGVTEKQANNLEKTRKTQNLVSFFAPQQGIVSMLAIREGMYVKPMMDLMTLVDLRTVWLQTAVFERQTDWVAMGGRAEAQLAYMPGERWTGKVDFIYPVLDPKTRTLKVRLRFDNPNERLKPNMYAKVIIFAPPRPDILTIPREAIIRSGQGERVVLALGEGRFQSRHIQSGMESDGLVEIRSGLQEGDAVVTSAQFLIDSQASLQGSLTRMEPLKAEQPDATLPDGIPGTGLLRQIIADERQVKLSHDPIPALNWPSMTMNIKLADGVALPDIPIDSKVTFTLHRVDDYAVEIIQIIPVADAHTVYQATGMVRKIIADSHTLKITHDPIPALNWPTMTMNFVLAPELSLTAIQVGQKLSFTLKKVGELEYQIVALQAVSGETVP